MTKKEDDIDISKPPEAEFVAEAVPAPSSNEPPIQEGHSRFYCNKCHTVRLLHHECVGVVSFLLY